MRLYNHDCSIGVLVEERMYVYERCCVNMLPRDHSETITGGGGGGADLRQHILGTPPKIGRLCVPPSEDCISLLIPHFCVFYGLIWASSVFLIINICQNLVPLRRLGKSEHRLCWMGKSGLPPQKPPSPVMLSEWSLMCWKCSRFITVTYEYMELFIVSFASTICQSTKLSNPVLILNIVKLFTIQNV